VGYLFVKIWDYFSEKWMKRRESQMTNWAWLIFIGAAILEVGGDAVIRRGLRGCSLIFIIIGVTMLGGYGLVVNMVKWDFSKLLGVYIAVFALISQLFGHFVFKENIPVVNWIGLMVIIIGGVIIQFGAKI
jgi:drug/metabolite transporter superfamily protein YnfA